MRLVSELRRRNVLRMVVLYVVAAWLIMQVAGVLMDLGALPGATGPWVLGALVIGFPIALVFSWLFEITPEGLALEKDVPEGTSITHITGRRMDFIVIAVLSAGLILFAWPDPENERNLFEIAVPKLGSFVDDGTLTSEEPGILTIPEDERPPLPIPFFGFRIMVAMGLLMVMKFVGGLVLISLLVS